MRVTPWGARVTAASNYVLRMPVRRVFDRILTIKRKWLDLILSTDPDDMKTLEIRGIPCNNAIGERVYFTASGEAAIVGSAILDACYGPLDAAGFAALRHAHRVPGKSLPYARTYAWKLTDVQQHAPVPIIRKPGAVIWQRGAELA